MEEKKTLKQWLEEKSDWAKWKALASPSISVKEEIPCSRK